MTTRSSYELEVQVVKFTRPGTDYPQPFSITLWISCIMVVCMSRFILLLLGCHWLTKTSAGFESGEENGAHRDSSEYCNGMFLCIMIGE